MRCLNTIWLEIRDSRLGYSRNNPKRGEGLRTWNFQGHWRKSMWKFLGSNKKEVEFPGVLKNHVEFPWVFVLTLEFFQGYLVTNVTHTNLQNSQLWKLVFPRISKGKMTNLKIPGVSEVHAHLPPCLFFSLINSPFRNQDSRSQINIDRSFNRSLCIFKF